MLQKQFNLDVSIAAMALCFKEEERSLTIDQLLARNFTPDPRYSKLCINDLLLAGVIQCRSIESISSGDKKNRHTFNVERPCRTDMYLHQFVTATVRRLRAELESNADCSYFLESLDLQLRACECIQYAIFFANRDELKIVDASPNDSNLQLLLQENAREQVFMLLWRSIKKYAESSMNSTNQVSFPDLIQTALEYYFIYQAKKSRIDFYPWPKQLGVSKLACIVGLLKK